MSSERTKTQRAPAESKPDKALPSAASDTQNQRHPRGAVARALAQPTTYFAPALRANQQEIETTIELVAQSPVTTALLRSATSMMCILNEHRQIVALNTALLDSLDVKHADDVIGQRPGEAMRCVHRDDHISGCGTGPHCRTCEAAIAVIASQSTSRPIERECLMCVTNRKGELHDLALSVRAAPFELKGERFTVLCMTDIGVQKLYQDLESSFLHDLSNLAMVLHASCEQLRQGGAAANPELIADACELTQRLSHEISVQRLLLRSDPTRYRINWQSIDLAKLLRFLERLATSHPSAQLKRYVVRSYPKQSELISDPALLERALANLLINAFEATEAGGMVELKVDSTELGLRFTIHNAGYISPSLAARLFHRHFSTKSGAGRGQGTYAVRLLGERLLRGQVGFTTDTDLGTDFFLELPLRPQHGKAAHRMP